MNATKYQILAERTAKSMPSKVEDLVHAALGLSGEAGEFTDAVKKSYIYGKPLDVHNLIEELGDAMWYIALAASKLGVGLEDIMQLNIQKLQRRYPEKYSDADAIARADKVGDPGAAQFAEQHLNYKYEG